MKKTVRFLSSIVLVLMLCVSLFSCGKEGSVKASETADGNMLYYTKSSVELSDTDNTEVQERKVIRDFSIDAETKDFDSKLGTVSALLDEFGGYVESSNVTEGTSYSFYINDTAPKTERRAYYELGVPTEKVEAFISRLGEELHVISSTSSSQDVSDTYYSAEARLEELVAERDSLVKMMESLESYKDNEFWLQLQRRISEVRQDISVLQAQIKDIDSRVAYSTVRLTMREVLDYSVVEEESFFSRFGHSFVDGWVDFFDGFLDFLVWFVGAIPTLLLLTAIGFATYAIVKKIIKKRKRNQG